jgi:prophage antirepressor-like protein
MNIKIEVWNEHKIRFVEKAPGDWWAVAADVCAALNIKNVSQAINGNEDAKAKGLPEKDRGIYKLYITSDKAKARKTQDVLVVSESGIYKLAFRSNKQEAEDFQDWVCGVIKTLRQAAGLEGFQVFRLLDKEH